jgi:hypothetical protein
VCHNCLWFLTAAACPQPCAPGVLTLCLCAFCAAGYGGGYGAGPDRGGASRYPPARSGPYERPR